MMRARQGVAVPAVVAGVILAVLAASAAAGVRVNLTPSMPRGLWWVVDAPISRGTVVVACLPDQAGTREAARRGYLRAGSCPGGTEPLVKPLAAIAGDVVTVTKRGLAVNSVPLPGTAPLAEDETGRALQAVPAGSYRVAAGEVWLLSGHDPRSYDSRYFGAVPAANVQGVARPLWVLR